jgi:hypothetical protein
MKHHLGALAATFTLLACGVSPSTISDQPPDPALTWHQDAGKSLTLRRGDETVWTFHYGADHPKPCFHPLALPGGRTLTVDSPADHAWHHGLWFSWKFLDGVNYWEHDGKTGRPAGRTQWRVDQLEPHADGSARIVLDLTYAPPDGEPVLGERRILTVTPPAADGTFVIDWSGAFDARADCTLDRTPPPEAPGGKANGGYGGFSLRLTRLENLDALTTAGPVVWNEAHRFRVDTAAFDCRGRIDGQDVGVAILAHSQNPRAPSPWYAVHTPQMTFFTPALLCHAPMTLTKGERFTLRYRVVVHRGRYDEKQLAAAVTEFERSKQ